MSTNDGLLTDAIAFRKSGADGENEPLAELFYRLRYGDEPDEYTLPAAVAAAKITLTCHTCAYATDSGSIEQRDEQHLRVDGAHEPGWIDEGGDEPNLIRSDLGLIELIVGRD